MTASRVRRILVALDNSPPSLAAAEAATRLAVVLDAEIVGLFVEDDRILGLGRLPVSREFDPLTATTREVGPGDLERQLRAQARRARRFLAGLAEEAGARWTFQVARGSVHDEILARARGVELVSLGRVGWSLAAGPRLGSTVRSLLSERRSRILVLTSAVPMAPHVTALHDGSATGRKAVRLAARWAAAQGEPLQVLLVGDEAALRADAAGALGAFARHATFVALAALPADRLAHVVALRSPGPLIVPVDGPALGESFLRALLARAEQPVLAVHGGEDDEPDENGEPARVGARGPRADEGDRGPD